MAGSEALQPDAEEKQRGLHSIWNDDLPWSDGFSRAEIESDTNAEVIVLPVFPQREYEASMDKDWG